LERKLKQRFKKIPGWLGISIITFLNAVWLFWGLGEAFYEGWGVPETPWGCFFSFQSQRWCFALLQSNSLILGNQFWFLSAFLLQLGGCFQDSKTDSIPLVLQWKDYFYPSDFPL
jgi:hypothetical protein